MKRQKAKGTEKTLTLKDISDHIEKEVMSCLERNKGVKIDHLGMVSPQPQKSEQEWRMNIDKQTKKVVVEEALTLDDIGLFIAKAKEKNRKSNRHQKVIFIAAIAVIILLPHLF